MSDRLQRHWPLLATLLLLYLALAAGLLVALVQNQGRLVYVLDDPYIHMAMAKNLAQHGVWGVTRYSFASASSSPLWTLALGLGYAVLGVNDVLPLAMNLILATLLVLLGYRALRRQGFGSGQTALVLTFAAFAIPLPALIYTGQEHILHLLLTLATVHDAGELVLSQRRSFPAPLIVLAILLTLTRYEGLFLVLVLGMLLMLRGQRRDALALVGAGSFGVTVYGLVCWSQGWYLLPNSVLLKANLSEGSSLMARVLSLVSSGYQQIHQQSVILFLTLACLILFLFRWPRWGSLWKRPAIGLATFALVTPLHMALARTGWFYRYEAYLVGFGLYAVVSVLQGPELCLVWQWKGWEQAPRYGAQGILLFLLIAPFVERGYTSLRSIPRASTNIYEQQVQMGSFLRTFYQGEAVAANDIGAINYLADVRCVDLWGLANMRVAQAKLTGNYTREFIEKLVNDEGVVIAIVYDHLLERRTVGGVPRPWVKVGQWRIRKNIVCESDTVSFYAMNPAEAERLAANLRLFSSRLPASVEQSGPYTMR